MSKRIDVEALPFIRGTLYPPPYHTSCKARGRKKISDEAGLTQFGVGILSLPPGVWSSQRHWHAKEDEFIYVLQGEVVLVTDEGEEVLKAGEAAGFKAGDGNGHHLQNRSDEEALVLEIGTRTNDDIAYYPDIDLVAQSSGKPALFTHKDGTPYDDIKRRGPDDD